MKKSKQEEIEVQITPMLDMAFQLLTFFILTYHPAPMEGQFAMNLLPAAPVLDTNTPPPDNAGPANPDIPAQLRTLTTILRAGPDGSLGRISIGDNDVEGVQGLRDRLKQIKADASPFDQALIKADTNLKYSALIEIVDVFSQADITKISFSELDVNAPGAAL